MKMKPGFKFFSWSGVAAIICCSLCTVEYCSSSDVSGLKSSAFIGVLSIIISDVSFSTALPPSYFHKRAGSPMPEIGSPVSIEEEDSDEEEDDLLESQPRVDPQITPLNRDQCLAKLLCGMSVPVTGGSTKRNYYSEYATTVSKFFEAFPLDDEMQSKESIETYDDYSTEDDGKPIRSNSKRKPLNSSRVGTTSPPLQLFDLALVDVAKAEDLERTNSTRTTRKQAIAKVSAWRGNRVARARKIVEHLGQKLQTVRQCQTIAGCPFTFKELRETLKRKEAQRVSSNVPLPGPLWPPKKHSDEKEPPFRPKPYVEPESRPRPLPPIPKLPQSTELFSNERQQEKRKRPVFPSKGDDELEEFFGPPPLSKRPLGFHQGVDENFNYEYNPDKPWRPGQTGGSNYASRPWNSRPRPPSGQSSQNGPPRPRPSTTGSSQKKSSPPSNYQNQPQSRPSAAEKPVVQHPPPPRTQPPKKKKPAGAFPKKKISYLSSPYKRPGNSEEDDEGAEDINKVAPVELVGNAEAGEAEPTKRTTTTEAPDEDEVTEATPVFPNKTKKKNDDESDEYDDDDYYEDDDYTDDEEEIEDEDSDEEADDKGTEKVKVKKEKNKNKKRKVKGQKGKGKGTEASTAEETATTAPKKKDQYVDDESDGVSDIWMKLNYATTGANQKPPEKLKKKEVVKSGATEDVAPKPTSVSEEDEADDEEDDDYEDDDDDDDEEDEEVKPEAVTSAPPPKKPKPAGSLVLDTSISNEDEADDEVDDHNASKRHKSKKTKVSPVQKAKEDHEEGKSPTNEYQDYPEPDIGPSEPVTEHSKGKKSKKDKKRKKKPGKKGSSEEDPESHEAGWRKHGLMEIGGRPLVPKQSYDQQNQQKTSTLLTNRFKFQFINPYGAAPPAVPGSMVPDLKTGGPPPPPQGPPGPYPMRSSFSQNGPNSAGSSISSMANSLPFKFRINAGPLGNLGGGGPESNVPLASFSGGGSSSGSVEMPDPHHPPPPTPFMKQNHPPPHHQFSHQQPNGGNNGGGGGGVSSLFKMNPIPALTSLFKRPSASSFDPLLGLEGHGPPPINAFIHRPIGPESNHFKKDRPSPASGSSNPMGKSGLNNGGKGGSKGTTKSKGKGNKKGKS